MRRLAIVTTHPIQYNAPLFELLSRRGKISIMVFYTWSQSEKMNIYDPGFGIYKAWDIPLLQGYPHQFSTNTAKQPGSHHFRGIKNPRLIQDIQKYNPDAVLVYGWKFYSHLRVLRYFKNRVPVYFRGDSTLIDDSGRSSIQRLLRATVLKWVYRHVDKAFYAGKENRKYYRSVGLHDHQLVFMPHAIDNKRFAAANNEEAAKLRLKLGIRQNEMAILFAGKLELKKDPETLLQAFMLLNCQGAHLVIVGNGELEAALKAKYRHAENLHFLPFQNQSAMPAIYAAADVYVLTSKGPGETWGLAVNEAMAAGKPVIVSDRAGCGADLVYEGLNGYIFRAGDAIDLKEKIAKVISLDSEGLNEMAAASRKIIAEWNYETCATVIEHNL